MPIPALERTASVWPVALEISKEASQLRITSTGEIQRCREDQVLDIANAAMALQSSTLLGRA